MVENKTGKNGFLGFKKERLRLPTGSYDLPSPFITRHVSFRIYDIASINPFWYVVHYHTHISFIH